MTIDQERDTERTPTTGPGRTSESEEMFLITVARAIEDGHEVPVPAPWIAEALSVSRVSANEMAKKLVNRGFIEYEPYHGVTLTPSGTAIANTVLRRRRLWALFLAEHLGLEPSDADAVACEFEHVTPARVAGRLAEFLGDPTVDPEGHTIPPAGSTSPVRSELTVADLEVGAQAKVVRIAGDKAIRSFLADQGMTNGTDLTVLAVGSDRGCLVETRQGRVHLSATIALNVVVSSTLA